MKLYKIFSFVAAAGLALSLTATAPAQGSFGFGYSQFGHHSGFSVGFSAPLYYNNYYRAGPAVGLGFERRYRVREFPHEPFLEMLRAFTDSKHYWGAALSPHREPISAFRVVSVVSAAAFVIRIDT